MTEIDHHRHIIGYTNKFAVAPGEEIELKISTSEVSYEVDVVSIAGSENRNSSMHFAEKVVRIATPGRVSGRRQTSQIGSFIKVPNLGREFSTPKSYTVCFSMKPTHLSVEKDQVLLGITDTHRRAGWELAIDERGYVTFEVLGARGASINTQCTVQAGEWYEIEAGLDFTRHKLALKVRGQDAEASVVEHKLLDTIRPLPTSAALLMGARRRLYSAVKGSYRGHEYEALFNGCLDDIRIIATPPSMFDADGASPSDVATLAWWDFSRDIAGSRVIDIGRSGYHGQITNIPARGVRGKNWTGDVLDFREDANQYSGIHLHDDDISDAAWDTDFTLRIPHDMPSGVYAVRCRTVQWSTGYPLW